VRYAPLSWANPLRLDDARNCAKVAADRDRSTENGLVWDIYSQTGGWLRSADASNPLAYGAHDAASSPVKHLLAWGYSQDGFFLYTYVNAIHPLDVKAHGRPIYDGYLVAMASVPAQINQCAAPIGPDDPRRMIRDAGVPVMRVMSQSDYLSGIAARRPDSDTTSDLYRNYEIAGAAHATPDELNTAATPADIMKGGRAVPPMACNEGPRSRFPNWVAFDAIWRNLVLWVDKGVPPPRAENIAIANGAPVLDKFGNVTAGIRSPYVDVPTSTWYGNSTGESFCRIAGHEVPFTSSQLHELYPSHKAYVDAVKADVARLEKQLWIVPADGDALIHEAETASIP
jgi:hypothetical protein